MRGLTHLSLFTGIGGLDLAAEWAGFRTVGQCEYADFPRKVLEKHWPNVQRWRDIRDVTRISADRAGIGEITVISGGFPCQPHSLAGKRLASGDERDLWGEFARVIHEVGPRWVVAENVPGLLSSEHGRFFGRVLGDLAGMGECYPLSKPARHISEKGFALLPTPCASDGHAIDFCRRLKSMRCVMAKPGKSIHLCYLTTLSGYSLAETIQIYETVMGFPARWTNLEP